MRFMSLPTPTLTPAPSIVQVFTFDPRWFSATSFNNGYLKTGPYRAQFLLESVADLKERLRGIGSDLLVTMGPPEETLPPLTGGKGTLVLAQAEVTSEETRAEAAVAAALAASNARLELRWGSTLFHLDDLPFDVARGLKDMPDVFTPFKQKCEDRCAVRAPLPAPRSGALPLPAGLDPAALDFLPKTVEELNAIVPAGAPKLMTLSSDSRSAFSLRGGEGAAWDRLRYYLWDSDLVYKYFEIRNGMLGGDYSTKLSPALAHGCISPRQIHAEIKKYEEARGSNKSTYWVIFELIWRDYFKFYAKKHGDAIFHAGGPAGRSPAWRTDPELLARWKEGRTGWPLVDANMRELAATGWMSNRGRQNVASFFALDLGLDWRVGADWFESLLLDHDPASNYGNWVAAAGLTGGRVNRFNITKQSKDYDEKGDYIRHWIPELKNVPASRIHEPWLMSKEEQERYGVRIGVDYPQAIPSSSFVGRSGGGGAPARFSNGSAHRGPGGGRSGGRSDGGGRGRGGDGRGRGRSGGANVRRTFQRKSEFDMYG